VPTHDIIVIGASAGGVEALIALVGGLPADFPAAIFVVVHFPAQSASALPRILTRAGPLPATHAQHEEAIRPGRIYVATPDCHLLVRPGVVHVVRGPRENHCRPAIDPLFRSAALAYGPRVIGVILSGTLGDGTAGLLTVKRQGGVAIIQDPASALFPEMPRNALEYVDVDYVLPLTEIAPVLVRLASEPVRETLSVGKSADQQNEVALAEADMATIENGKPSGTPSVFGCPECGGTLWELQEDELLRFRCRTGHAFSSDSLLSVQAEALEGALWAALRGLEENAALARRMAARARGRNLIRAAETFEERARAAEQQAAIIRQVIVDSKLRGTQASEENSE
jgi:two-component system, chemotaxis family, protein-glutamate methylesterase/glutaminase